jgi:short-subunit dehydrogenase
LRTLSLNLTSVILGCRRAAPVMCRQGSGTIINISSVCAKYSWPGWSIYSAAKAGVERFSKGLYTEVRPHGVRVTTLTPSWGATDFCDASELSGHPSTHSSVRERCTHPLELGKIVADIVATPAHLEILELTVVPTVQDISPL